MPSHLPCFLSMFSWYFIQVSHIYPAWTPYVIFKSLLLRNFWENEKDITNISQPILILSAPKDAQVPSWMSQKLFESAGKSVFKVTDYSQQQGLPAF